MNGSEITQNLLNSSPPGILKLRTFNHCSIPAGATRCSWQVLKAISEKMFSSKTVRIAASTYNHPSKMEPTNNPEQAWHIQKEKMLLQFKHLSESDFHYDYGMKDVMLCQLEIKLGKTREELNTLLVSYNNEVAAT
jgi:hypothetical protein